MVFIDRFNCSQVGANHRRFFVIFKMAENSQISLKGMSDHSSMPGIDPFFSPTIPGWQLAQPWPGVPTFQEGSADQVDTAYQIPWYNKIPQLVPRGMQGFFLSTSVAYTATPISSERIGIACVYTEKYNPASVMVLPCSIRILQYDSNVQYRFITGNV